MKVYRAGTPEGDSVKVVDEHGNVVPFVREVGFDPSVQSGGSYYLQYMVDECDDLVLGDFETDINGRSVRPFIMKLWHKNFDLVDETGLVIASHRNLSSFLAWEEEPTEDDTEFHAKVEKLIKEKDNG